MVRAKDHYIALVVPGLHKTLWQKKIAEFENDPRLCRSITGLSAEDTEATRARWQAAKLGELQRRGVPTSRQRYTAGEPIAFPRWMLSGNGPFQAFAVHPLASDPSVRWLRCDCDDVVTVSQEGP